MGALAIAVMLAAGSAAAANRAKAKTLYAEGDFAAAVQEFEALSKSEKDPKLLYDIGEAHRQLGDAREAVRAYSQYLSAVPNAANAGEVQKRIVELTPQTFENAPPPATDTTPPRITHTPPPNVPPGQPLTIEAVIEDPSGVFDPTLYYRTSAEGKFTPLGMHPGEGAKFVAIVPPLKGGELQYYVEAYDNQGNGPARTGTPTYPHRARVGGPAVAGTTGETGNPDEIPGVETHAKHGPWSYAAGGAGVVSVLVGAFFGNRMRSTSNDLLGSPHPRATVDAQAAQVSGDATKANVLFGVAGALIIGAGVLWYIGQ